MSERDGDARVLDVLEAWFLERDGGGTPDVLALCRGDRELATQVQRLIDTQPEAVSFLLQGPVAAAEDLGVPDRLGEFRLLRRLGSGGMGSVYLAEQESLARLVALKVVGPWAPSDAAARLRFRREAEITASLDHPGIVPVHAVGEDQGYAYIAMKCLSGPSLDRAGVQPPRRVAEIGAAVARALDLAHQAGVVHRDVKPGNVLLDGDRPVVVDFGLARAHTDQTLTRAGAVPGTLAYMAPEQLRRDARALDPSTDVYALGATLYELASGGPPFRGEAPEQVVQRILLEDPPPLRLGSGARDLETIIRRALEKDRTRRFPTALAMAEDLERFLAGEPIHSRRSGILARAYKRARRHPRTSLGVAVGAAAVLALAAGLAAMSATRQRERGETLTLARRQVAEGDLDGALALLSAIDDPEAAELRRQAAARRAYEELLDELTNHPQQVHRPSLERAMAAMEEAPRALDAGRERSARLALALGARLLDDRPAMERHLAAAGDGPARRAIAAASGEAAALELATADPGSATGGPDEWLLVASLLASLDRPEADVRSALRRSPLAEDPRAERLEAAMLHHAGKVRDAAYLVESLVRRGRRDRSTLRVLAKARLALGDPRGARAALEAIPEGSWTPSEAHVMLEVAEADGDRAKLEELLRGYRARPSWAEDATLTRAAADIALRSGDHERAVSLAEEAVARATLAPVRDLCIASLVRIRDAALDARAGTEARLPVAPGAVDPALRREALELIGAAERSLATLVSPRAKADVLWFMARAATRIGEPFRAFELLERASVEDSNATGPRLEYGCLVADLLARSGAGSAWAEVLEEVEGDVSERVRESGLVAGLLASEARRRVEAVLRERKDGLVALEKDQVAAALKVLAFLAQAPGPDLAGRLAALEASAAALGEAALPPQFLSVLCRLREARRLIRDARGWSVDDLELVPALRREG